MRVNGRYDARRPVLGHEDEWTKACTRVKTTVAPMFRESFSFSVIAMRYAPIAQHDSPVPSSDLSHSNPALQKKRFKRSQEAPAP